MNNRLKKLYLISNGVPIKINEHCKGFMKMIFYEDYPRSVI